MKVGTQLRRLMLGIAGATFALPLFVMLSMSVKPDEEIATGHSLSLPHAVFTGAWVMAWSHACIGTACDGLSVWFCHSLAIAIPSLTLSLAIGAISAHALLERAMASRVILALLFLGLLMPPQVTLYPTIILLRYIGLFASTPGLILVHVIWGLPFVTLLFKTFFSSLPPELFRMAEIDGASFPVVLLKLLVPASLPVIASAGILQFTFIWNDYLLGTTFGNSSEFPIMVALYALASPQYGHTQYNVSMAAAVIASIPTLVLYFFSWKLLARGMHGVATKS